MITSKSLVTYGWIALVLSAFMIAAPNVVSAALGTPEFCVTASTGLGAPGTVTPTSGVCADTGTYVAINATPSSGAEFVSWSIPANCSFSEGYGNTAKTRVTCNASSNPYLEYTVMASFKTITTTTTEPTTSVSTTTEPTTTVPAGQFCVNATVVTSGGGAVYPTSYTCFDSGSPASIIATSSSGFAFSTWVLSSGCSYASGYGNSASTQVTCNAGSTKPYPKYTATAVFVQTSTTSSSTTTVSSTQYCVNASLYSPSLGGTVYPTFQSCASASQSVYIYATPPNGYGFSRWVLPNGCTFAQGYSNSASTNIVCAAGTYQYPRYTVYAQFYSTTTVSPEFCVNATLYSPGIGGSVAPKSGCAFSGQSVSIAASAPPGYTFNAWYLPGTCSFASGYGNTATTQVTCVSGAYPFPRYSIAAGFSSSYTPSAGTSATVSISRGWNLFSVPLVSSTLSSSTCSSGELLSPIWQLTNGAYSKASSIQGGVGYWVNSAAQCTLTFSGSPLSISQIPALTAGWNLVGALNYTNSFTNIFGNCNVTSGPLGFDTGTNSYYNSTQIAPGNGYFVKVSGSCSLGSSNLPPAPP